jgi:enoyl-CoA hydratase
VILSEVFSPENAVEAGFLDRVVEAAQVPSTVDELTAALGALDMGAHAASKLRARGQSLTAIRAAIADDEAAFRSSPA